MEEVSFYIKLKKYRVPLKLELIEKIFGQLQRNSKNPFWHSDIPVDERKMVFDSMYPDYDLWYRFTDVESSGEFEELDSALGTNRREKIHKFRVRCREQGLAQSDRHNTPQFIQVAMEFKRRAKADEEFQRKRMKFSGMRALREVPYEDQDDAELSYNFADMSLADGASVVGSISEEDFDQQTEEEVQMSSGSS